MICCYGLGLFPDLAGLHYPGGLNDVEHFRNIICLHAFSPPRLFLDVPFVPGTDLK